MKSVSDASKKKSRYVICKKCGGRIPLGEECCQYCDASVNENPSVFDKLASFLSRFGIHANTATVKKAAIAVVLVVVAIAAVSCLFSPSYERAYTDEQIVDEALSVFNSKMKAKTGGGTESLFLTPMQRTAQWNMILAPTGITARLMPHIRQMFLIFSVQVQQNMLSVPYTMTTEKNLYSKSLK